MGIGDMLQARFDTQDAARYRELRKRAHDILRPELIEQWQRSEAPSALDFVVDGMLIERQQASASTPHE